MSTLDKDQVIEKFTEAYKAAHGKKPTIEANAGWYSVDGGKNVRLATLEEMTEEMGSASPSAKKSAPKKAQAKADTPAAKKDDKPAAKKADKKAKAKKPAKAKKSKKAAKKTDGFSVKAFWNDQIDARNPGSKHPR